MGLVDGFFLLGLFLFGVPIAALIGAVLGKLLGMPRLGGCLPGLVLLTIIFGVPVALAVSGVRATAYVAEKRERVRVQSYTGDWYNDYSLVVHYKPPEAARADFTSQSPLTDSLTLVVASTRELYDRARVGAPVHVLYLPFRPSIGKLADRSFTDLLREMMAVPGVTVGLVLLLAVAFAIWLSNRSWKNPAARRLRVVLYVLCFAVVMTAMWRGYQNPVSVAESAVNTETIGKIVQSRRIDRTLFTMSSSTHSSAPLAQPFDVVEVEFTPKGLNQTVHGADAVDSGTVRGLDAGQPLRVYYDVRAPRTMRIAGGTRTFRERNARDIAEQIVIVLALLLALVGLSAVLARRKKLRASHRTPATN